MKAFFTTKDPLDEIIAQHLSDQKIKKTQHILTGWTNIVIEVTTNKNSYFFRFPRNPFWSRMIVKDAAVCNFVEKKTSFYTPSMKLCYDKKKRPFSVHKKIEGYTLGDRIYNLSHATVTGVAYDIARFVKELSSINLKDAPEIVHYPLSRFLHELDYEHYVQHIDKDHSFIKQVDDTKLVHGDLNIGNILIDKNGKMIGVIDFCFAGTGSPNMDVARMLSRPVPVEFEQSLLEEFQDSKVEINHLRSIWKNIDAGYADHIRRHFPEIILPNLE